MTSPRHQSSKLDSAKSMEQSLERWLAPLRDVPAPPRASGGPEAALARRTNHIQKLGALISQVPTEQAKVRRNLHWRLGSMAAAALAIAASTTFFLLNSPAETHTASQARPAEQSPVVLRHLFGQVVSSQQGRSKVLAEGATLAAGDQLSTTAEAFASLDIEAVRVDLTSATTVELVRTGQRDQAYRLRVGRVDVSVPHVPGESRRVEVITPDSIVKVRGTVFSVEVNEINGTSVTRVGVTRGSVGIENSGRVHIVNAGEQWSSPHQSTDNPTEALQPQNNPEDSDDSDLLQANAAARPTAERSSLKDQNQLFSRALQAQRRGNHRLAVQLYSSLLKRYPDSPLAPTAKTELEQARAELDGNK
jgi:TolA-binding protein